MTPTPSLQPLMTAGQVAALLGVSRGFVYARRLDIGCVNLGRAIRFSHEAVQKFITARTESIPDRIAKLTIT